MLWARVVSLPLVLSLAVASSAVSLRERSSLSLASNASADVVVNTDTDAFPTRRAEMDQALSPTWQPWWLLESLGAAVQGAWREFSVFLSWLVRHHPSPGDGREGLFPWPTAPGDSRWKSFFGSQAWPTGSRELHALCAGLSFVAASYFFYCGAKFADQETHHGLRFHALLAFATYSVACLHLVYVRPSGAEPPNRALLYLTHVVSTSAVLVACGGALGVAHRKLVGLTLLSAAAWVALLAASLADQPAVRLLCAAASAFGGLCALQCTQRSAEEDADVLPLEVATASWGFYLVAWVVAPTGLRLDVVQCMLDCMMTAVCGFLLLRNEAQLACAFRKLERDDEA